MLLNCSTSWCQSKVGIDHPSTGKVEQLDTTITIGINTVKTINDKLLERNYLIESNKIKDSIIVMKDNYINKQHTIIVDFQKRVDEANKLNQNVKRYKKVANTSYIVGIAGFILGLFVNIIK